MPGAASLPSPPSTAPTATASPVRPNAGAPPVAKWESLADPVVLAQQMWNHGAKMKEAFARRKISRPTLTAQELTDMLVYLQNLPETRTPGRQLFVPAVGFRREAIRIQRLLGMPCRQTGAGVAAEESDAYQNRGRDVGAPAQHEAAPAAVLAGGDAADSVLCLGTAIFQRGWLGKPRTKVFLDKNCATCHNDASSGAPRLSKGEDGYSAITMVSALWEHGPQMLERMNQRKLAWPRFTSQQMADLIAYLNSL